MLSPLLPPVLLLSPQPWWHKGTSDTKGLEYFSNEHFTSTTFLGESICLCIYFLHTGQISGHHSKENHCQGAVRQRGFGKTTPGAKGLQSSVLLLLSARVQGRLQSFINHVIRFSAAEEVCGWQGVAKVPLFTVGQFHQPHEDATVPIINLIFTTEVLLVAVLLSANSSPWRLFSPAPKHFLHLKILTSPQYT